MTIGGLRLPGLSDRSRLGEESRDEGLEDSDRGEMGLGWRPLGESSEKHKGPFSSECVHRISKQYLSSQYGAVFMTIQNVCMSHT